MILACSVEEETGSLSKENGRSSDKRGEQRIERAPCIGTDVGGAGVRVCVCAQEKEERAVKREGKQSHLHTPEKKGKKT